MSSDQGGEGGSGPNRTVFRPSPLQGLNQGGAPGPGDTPPPAAQPARPRPQDDVPQAPAGAWGTSSCGLGRAGWAAGGGVSPGPGAPP